MSGKPTSPYHIDQQYADALLRPVGDTLAELEKRLAHYVERLYLGGGDQARVEAARVIIADAHRQLQILTGPMAAGVAPRNES